MPDSFCLNSLSYTKEDALVVSKFRRLVDIELMIHLKFVRGMTVDKISKELKERGVPTIDDLAFLDLLSVLQKTVCMGERTNQANTQSVHRCIGWVVLCDRTWKLAVG